MDAVTDFVNSIFEWLGINQKDNLIIGPAPEPVNKNVALITFNPLVEGNQRLQTIMKWNDPDRLCQQYISDLEYCSYGYVKYKIVEELLVDHFPILEDGYTYTPHEYLNNIQSMSGFHRPEMADYTSILEEFDLVNKVNNQQVDEVWLMGFPYAGFYESRMVGGNAFWCNGPAITQIPQTDKRFIVMGFNYERGVGEMLEDFCHRTESILEYVFRNKLGERNLWHKFIRYDKTSPGRSEVGSVHYAPNSITDYDWGNPQQVLSCCDTWNIYPDLSGPARLVNCSEWGNGDIREHHIWWLRHLPHLGGVLGNTSNNWWKYIISPETVI